MPWYEESFGEDYLLVYKHRSRERADREIEAVVHWLGLKPGAALLDLCCGTGRHSIPLYHHGFSVTGVDLSPVLLQVAKTESAGLDLPFYRGDMRELPFEADSFDGVVNLFTSFGYFEEDEENERVLQEMTRVVKPKGRFVIDYLNHAAVERGLVPESERMEDGARIREKRWIEEGFVKKEIEVTDDRGTRRYREQVKLYTREQMEGLMAQAGLVVESVKGDFDSSRYVKAESPRMIFTGSVKG
ncbi:class I SAM-dependent methyltransferase [Desmospora profundinema]|uniref:Ubiquinone/menaquinone biosynthesis C-methylase UbiE n=1 Tax=Desmospora profundinema TaxID=1571184 RepID=A0ABU1IN81_9BACL|nr:methyltransferase domain-containing protein [Desmospora profundinema]MDR6226241.1 ubiquinone/menaquinone biosynthesis C-methylase UbiE [Desmospora profundinema]